MNLKTYLEAKKNRDVDSRESRAYCRTCTKPQLTCYCSQIVPVVSSIQFVILMHPKETKRSIATGRMAHLCLSNSLVFEGVDFSERPEVNTLLQSPLHHCVVLAPGPRSVDLTLISESDRQSVFLKNKKRVVFLIDGTWSEARRIYRMSQNINRLKAICFSPTAPSGFAVRKQPQSHCYSTVEAIHTCLSFFDKEMARYESLLKAFSYMVGQQVHFESVEGGPRHYRSIRGIRTGAKSEAVPITYPLR